MTTKFSEDIKPVTDLKNRASEIIQQVKETGRPVLITQRGRGSIVIESIESYERKEEHYALIEELLASMRQAREGKLHSNEEAMRLLDSCGKG